MMHTVILGFPLFYYKKKTNPKMLRTVLKHSTTMSFFVLTVYCFKND